MQHQYGAGDANSPAGDAVAVTPGDTTDLVKDGMRPRGLYIGTGGNVRVQMRSEAGTVDFVNVLSGTILPIMVDRVHSTSTTATNIIALY